MASSGSALVGEACTPARTCCLNAKELGDGVRARRAQAAARRARWYCRERSSTRRLATAGVARARAACKSPGVLLAGAAACAADTHASTVSTSRGWSAGSKPSEAQKSGRDMSSTHSSTYSGWSVTISPITMAPGSAVVSTSGLSLLIANCLNRSAVNSMGKLRLVSASDTQPTFVMFFEQTRVKYSATAAATSSRIFAARTFPAITERRLA
mmetsp:Transcript_67190/g.216768  ORF Transcript_67190/g.216768 Transcript_67190/m.216768 type:complete len:212 (+) Transcript_67190:1429-2064(+)